MPANNAYKETHGDYEKVAWLSPLLRHRVIVCKDDIQYIYQIKEGKNDWRGVSFHTGWGSLLRRYPDLELMGCPLDGPNLLSNEIRKLLGAAVETIEGSAESGEDVDLGTGSGGDLKAVNGTLY
jgi:hypothetical protein